MFRNALLLSFFVSAQVFGATLTISQGDVFQGEELVNERKTGRSCTVEVNSVVPNDKGLHCFDLNINITHPEFIKVSSLKLSSRITNAHRNEYPKVKSCATNQSGETWGDDIYSEDTSNLVTDIFSGAHKERRVHLDYFLALNIQGKDPSHTRIHLMNAWQELDYDCVNLQKLN